MEPRAWTPIKVAIAVSVVIVSLGFSAVLIVFIIRRSGGNPPPLPPPPDRDEICQGLPYSSVPVHVITVGLAEPVADWVSCPFWEATTESALGAGWNPPSPQRRLSTETCRTYRVPLDYSQGPAGGSITDCETLSFGHRRRRPALVYARRPRCAFASLAI